MHQNIATDTTEENCWDGNSIGSMSISDARNHMDNEIDLPQMNTTTDVGMELEANAATNNAKRLADSRYLQKPEKTHQNTRKRLSEENSRSATHHSEKKQHVSSTRASKKAKNPEELMKMLDDLNKSARHLGSPSCGKLLVRLTIDLGRFTIFKDPINIE